jgi:hypothetical protein
MHAVRQHQRHMNTCCVCVNLHVYGAAFSTVLRSPTGKECSVALRVFEDADLGIPDGTSLTINASYTLCSVIVVLNVCKTLLQHILCAQVYCVCVSCTFMPAYMCMYMRCPCSLVVLQKFNISFIFKNFVQYMPHSPPTCRCVICWYLCVAL